jgi:hypothetical protein
MKKAISWIKECDGHFCNTISEFALLVTMMLTIYHCIALIS